MSLFHELPFDIGDGPKEKLQIKAEHFYRLVETFKITRN